MIEEATNTIFQVGGAISVILLAGLVLTFRYLNKLLKDKDVIIERQSQTYKDVIADKDRIIAEKDQEIKENSQELTALVRETIEVNTKLTEVLSYYTNEKK